MEGEFLFFLLFLIHLWKSHLSTHLSTEGYCFILLMFSLDLVQQILDLGKHLDHAVFKLSDAFFYFFFHDLCLSEADPGFWGWFSVCQFWARVTSSVIRITYPNCCYFTVSKNVPLKIAYKYFTSFNKEELWTAFSLFNRRKHPLWPAKKPPPLPNLFAGLCAWNWYCHCTNCKALGSVGRQINLPPEGACRQGKPASS